jgi:pimeloyl-ACP methyl ester carboxylesterase
MGEFVRTSYFSPMFDQEKMKKIILDMASASPEMALDALEELLKYDGAESLKQANLSVRCVNSGWITSSFQVTRTHAKFLWVDYIEKIGHFVMLEKPLQFNRFLAGYISEFVTEFYQ